MDWLARTVHDKNQNDHRTDRRRVPGRRLINFGFDAAHVWLSRYLRGERINMSESCGIPFNFVDRTMSNTQCSAQIQMFGDIEDDTAWWNMARLCEGWYVAHASPQLRLSVARHVGLRSSGRPTTRMCRGTAELLRDSPVARSSLRLR